MSRWLIGGVAVMSAALAVALFRPAEPVSAAPPEERNFDKDAAVRVIRKGSGESYFLSQPRAVRVADRGFLYGWKVNGDAALYIPVSEIELIEEFGSVDRMKKAYRLDPPKPEEATPVKEKR